MGGLRSLRRAVAKHKRIAWPRMRRGRPQSRRGRHGGPTWYELMARWRRRSLGKVLR